MGLVRELLTQGATLLRAALAGLPLLVRAMPLAQGLAREPVQVTMTSHPQTRRLQNLSPWAGTRTYSKLRPAHLCCSCI